MTWPGHLICLENCFVPCVQPGFPSHAYLFGNEEHGTCCWAGSPRQPMQLGKKCGKLWLRVGNKLQEELGFSGRAEKSWGEEPRPQALLYSHRDTYLCRRRLLSSPDSRADDSKRETPGMHPWMAEGLHQ